MIGSFGDAEVFSFHATKFFNTFEGGAVVTDNDELAAQIRLMKNFGFAGYDNVDFIGTNGKMTEVSAAMGLSSLESLDEFIEVNRRNYHAYRNGLADIPGVKLIDYNSAEKCNYQYVILEIDEETAGIDRDQLVRVLHAENVVARRYFYPGCHQMEPYRSYFPHARLLLHQTEWLADRVMSLPNGTSVSSADVETVCGIIRVAVTNAADLRAGLESKGRL
jgi:dTDP-4-amino-4,6-dideoxygalactose transaminase